MGYNGDGRAKRTRKAWAQRQRGLRQAGNSIGFVQSGSKGDPSLLRSAANTMKHPAQRLGEAITAALDPARAPGKVKTFAEMTPEEREEMRRLYEKKP